MNCNGSATQFLISMDEHWMIRRRAHWSRVSTATLPPKNTV